MSSTHTVSTCLWFDGNGEEAAEFYASLLPNSEITGRLSTEPGKPALLITFTIAGTPYQALNGGPQFKHSEAASIVVVTPDQAETDRLWSALSGNGGSEGMCGWLKDRWGVSWQIVPAGVLPLLQAGDREAAGRAMAALMQMRKIDVAALEAAVRGDLRG